MVNIGITEEGKTQYVLIIYIFNLKGIQIMSRQLFVESLPKIMYNHHQTGHTDLVVAGLPFRDQFNYVFNPLVITELNAVDASIINH